MMTPVPTPVVGTALPRISRVAPSVWIRTTEGRSTRTISAVESASPLGTATDVALGREVAASGVAVAPPSPPLQATEKVTAVATSKTRSGRAKRGAVTLGSSPGGARRAVQLDDP